MGNTGFTLSRNSFVYEDLVIRIQRIQEQLKIGIQLLDDRWENSRETKNGIKYRSFIFIDPFGNRIRFQCMDHELLRDVFRKFKQQYVPKYLQESIQIGFAHGNSIFVLNQQQSISTVSMYDESTEFSTYVKVIAWIGTFESLRMKKLSLNVLPISDMGKITKELKHSLKSTDLELRSIQIDSLFQLDRLKWTNGTTLKSKDTIISHKLYEPNRMIMVKCVRSHGFDLEIYVRMNDRTTISLEVTSDMTIEDVKTLIECREGISIDQQCLVFAEKQLDDQQTLQDAKIQSKDALDLVFNLQNEIYYFTGGRQRFSTLPFGIATTIRNIMKFKLKKFKNPNKLQKYVLQGQILLQNLVHLPDLKDFFH